MIEALQAAIVHDLAGYMTSINGLAEIVAARPDHVAREELIATLSRETRVAIQAVKDLQLVRALEKGSVVERIEDVSVEQTFSQVREALPPELGSRLAPPAPGLPPVRADAEQLVSLLTRLIELAAATNAEAPSAVRAAAAPGAVAIGIDLGPPGEMNDVSEGRASGRKTMRPVALADLLLPRWGGSMHVETTEGRVGLALALATSAPNATRA